MNTPNSGENNETPPDSPQYPPANSSEAGVSPIGEAEKYKDLAMRCQAELDNYRKRIVREREDTIRYANITLLERLLPIIDSFELGLEAAKNATESSSILIGMGMVQKQLLDFLRESGIQPVETVGAHFDPHFHDAVSHEYSNEIQEGHIIRQLRSGYKLKDRLLRPATVVVSKGASPTAANHS